MQINISYDSSVNAAPAAFATTIAAVAAYYESAITNPVTIDIAVGYGEVDGQTVTSAGESGTTLFSYGWGQIRQALATRATTTADQQAVAALPTADPSDGAGFAIPAAEANLLGLTSTIARAYSGFSSTIAWNFDTTSTAVPGELDFFGVVAHEFSEIMGRVCDVGTGAMSVLDLFRYSAPGVRATASGGTAYFSLDGGTTDLAHFNTSPGGDQGDWASVNGNDSYDAFSASGVANPVSSTDLAVLGALGYTLAPGAAPTGVVTAAVPQAALPDVSASLTPTNQTILNGVLASLTRGVTAMNVVDIAGGASAAQSVPGQLNALVVAAAATGAAAILPNGYALAYLLGGTGTSLSDSNGGSLLVATAAGGTAAGAAGDTLVGGNGGETLIAGAGAETLVGGTGASLFVLGMGADSVVSRGSDTIIGGAGPATITASGAPMIFAAGGALDVVGYGGVPTLVGGGAETVHAGAAAALVFGAASLAFAAGSGASTVVSGPGGSATLTGGTAPLLFFGNGRANYTAGAAVDTILGGAGSLAATGGANGTLFFGGNAGGNRIFSGTGAATIIGGGDGDVLTANGSGADVIAAAGGPATIDGSGSSGGNTFFGGGGADCIVGGAGSTAIVAGSGNETLVAGSGTTLFMIASGVSGRADVIANFNPAADFVQLAGYAPGAVATALQAASVVGGSTVLALPDGTHITFLGVSGLSASSFV